MKNLFAYIFCAFCVFVEFVEVRTGYTHYNLKLWKKYFGNDGFNWERVAIFQAFDSIRRKSFGVQ